MTGIPPDGAIVMFRRTTWTSPARRASTRGRADASTIFISYIANAAPMHLRRPPPNGSHSEGDGLKVRNLSGTKRVGSG
jgi:hypothetical protein